MRATRLTLFGIALVLASTARTEAEACPRFAAPACPKDQVIVSQPYQGRSDCFKPVCFKCPHYPTPVCKNREKVILNEDKDGCPKPQCMKPEL